ncbi:hypothetical protein [Streptomyces sp. NPDC001658]
MAEKSRPPGIGRSGSTLSSATSTRPGVGRPPGAGGAASLTARRTVGGHPGFLGGVAVINVAGGVLGGVAVGMAPRLAMTLATMVRRPLFTEAERRYGKASWLFGAAFIPEGAAPSPSPTWSTRRATAVRRRPGRWHRPRRYRHPM